MKNRVLKLIIMSYLPGLILIIVDYLFSSKNPFITWIFMFIWSIYVFILLIVYYLFERRGR
ncbi:MAG: hypothetical protein QXU89_03510 [Desulfurococcaceae archaeon]|uniref:Uncharacterized protein n=1 Tax=Staphylothermus marinus TaxID=2280 RepID=A0A7C4D9D1_STAMA